MNSALVGDAGHAQSLGDVCTGRTYSSRVRRDPMKSFYALCLAQGAVALACGVVGALSCGGQTPPQGQTSGSGLGVGGSGSGTAGASGAVSSGESNPTASSGKGASTGSGGSGGSSAASGA